MAMIALTLYGRPECHLCDEMKAIVQPVAVDFGCAIETIDIAGDADLERRFGHEIPVLFVNGRKAFKYRVTAAELARRLSQKRRPFLSRLLGAIGKDPS